ncbi:L,D-transpeptidase family protein [Thermovibrio ammonificans]|uniref:ErfK/YbiS/YcfS/YnhG family protein n=1 Tax=Thermovibrio ammonificans (strain DSM 15698 / JCM 12110 / HB-1) TaxID=648996 RepID=E8T4Z0_THEA1|nr:L,D-transpeptidase family protein [Thermovibrio ammonificans]ADU97522.1 ErfK/YbiS/YcfS/YnhG family protein [Thermovibrio ammonificans HB-1]
MLRAILLALLITLTALSPGRGTTLTEIVENLGVWSVPKLEQEIRKLPQEERLKLQLLLLTYAGDSKKAKELLSKLYNTKLVANVLELPRDLHAIVVDKTNEVLYVIRMENGVPFIVRKFPCITGKRPGDKLEEGDQRTPEGIYFPMYWETNLPPIYGIGAFPLNYPNLLDRKILKRNGHGIWIHGTNNPNRPPHSTNGCIVLKNEYLRELKKLIVPKRTPVVVVSHLAYATKPEFLKEQRSIINFVLKWKRAWENTPKSLKPYFECYSKHFVWERGGLKEWIAHKERVTKHKRWIKISISDLCAMKDGRLLQFGNLYVVRMRLKYRSNNYNSITNKVLYIIKEGGRWKILGEENL